MLVLIVVFLLRLAAGEERLVLITGCGHSGTLYVSEVLSQAGLDVGHETMKSKGVISWPMNFVTKDVPFTSKIGSEGYTFKHTFHQVRDPLKVINSWHSRHPRSDSAEWKYIYKHLNTPNNVKIDPKSSNIVRCAQYYYHWNLIAEAKSEYRYRVEDIDIVLPEISNRLGVELDLKVLETIPKNLNKGWGKPTVTWELLEKSLTKEDYTNLKEMAIRYGYSAS